MASLSEEDKALFKRLVEEHYQYVFAVCFSILVNEHDAEDMAQETLLRGFLKRDDLGNVGQFRPWITRVARNLCVDLLRNQKHRKPTRQDPKPASQQETETQAALEMAIKRLPEELRVPLLMYHFDGQNARSIAKHLNISHSNACQKLKRARRRLHELITGRSDK